MSSNVRAVADTLTAHGVDTVFGLMGNGNLDLIADLIDRKGARYLGLRHENAAVAAADGFFRAGGRIGLATVTHGPGFTNALTALVTAHRARSRLLLIAGNASGYTHRSTQKLDQRRLAEALGIKVISPAAQDDWAHATEQALRLAEEDAVLLDLPAEAMRLEAKRGAPEPDAHQAASRPDPAAIHQAVDLLEKAQRPLIIAGRGAMRAGMRDQLVALARRHGARLGTSLAAKGLFSGEPGDIGLIGGLASPLSMAACRECDVVLVAGASLNGFTTEHATLLRAATLIRIDENPAAPSTLEVHVPLIGAMPDILAAFAGETGRTTPWAITADAAPKVQASSWPHPVFEELDRILPEQRAVVFDHGDHANGAVPFFRAHDPSQSLFMADFGSIGLSVAAAIGAATARPERRTLAVIGDGALMMSLPELDTLKRSGAPVTVLVLNDGVYGAEYPHLAALGASLAPASFASEPIAGIAKAIGIDSLRLEEGSNLAGLTEAVACAGPFLVEVSCAPPRAHHG